MSGFAADSQSFLCGFYPIEWGFRSQYFASVRHQPSTERTNTMLMTIIIILLILWLLGMLTSSTLGGLIHILLVVAVIIIVVRLLQGRKIL